MDPRRSPEAVRGDRESQKRSKHLSRSTSRRFRPPEAPRLPNALARIPLGGSSAPEHRKDSHEEAHPDDPGLGSKEAPTHTHHFPKRLQRTPDELQIDQQPTISQRGTSRGPFAFTHRATVEKREGMRARDKTRKGNGKAEAAESLPLRETDGRRNGKGREGMAARGTAKGEGRN